VIRASEPPLAGCRPLRQAKDDVVDVCVRFIARVDSIQARFKMLPGQERTFV
jgi:hypothetical protein